jgi:hypothetical protein
VEVRVRASLRGAGRQAFAAAAIIGCALAARDVAAGEPPDRMERAGGEEKPAAADGSIERSPEFIAAVAAAIDRGVAHLRTQQQADGGFGMHPGYPCGLTAMAYHTLRTCGVPDSDKDAARAYEALRREYRDAKAKGEIRTYAAGLTMLAIADHALSWTPDRTKGRSAPKRLLDERDRTWMNELVLYFENNQAARGAWRYGEIQPYAQGVPNPEDFDHSNTQYAAQGLRAAALLGCEVKAETWRKLAEHLVVTQEKDGPEVTLAAPPRPSEKRYGPVKVQARARGWGYREAGSGRYEKANENEVRAYGSMTAGSLASLVIARNALGVRTVKDAALLSRADVAIRDGIGWLAVHFDVRRNPEYTGWHTYWLYALERAGDLADVEWMGEHDWYGKGARLLVGAQREDGSWNDAVPSPVAICFALLFLRRAERVMETRTTAVAEEPVRFDLAPKLGEKDFEDLVDQALARWRRAPDETTRAGLGTGAASVGPRIVLPLLARMDGPDAAKRRAAHELLRRATGLRFHFDPDADAAARAEALRAFEAWYVSAGPRLRFDARSGMLVDG